MHTGEFAWSHTTIKVLGATMIGIDGFGFNKKFDKEVLYGAGDEPIDIQTGNKSYDGTLDLKKYEVDKLNDAAIAAGYEDITEVPHEAIVITTSFKKTSADKTRTIVCTGVAFTGLPQSMKQGEKQMPVSLPFIAIKITSK